MGKGSICSGIPRKLFRIAARTPHPEREYPSERIPRSPWRPPYSLSISTTLRTLRALLIMLKTKPTHQPPQKFFLPSKSSPAQYITLLQPAPPSFCRIFIYILILLIKIMSPSSLSISSPLSPRRFSTPASSSSSTLSSSYLFSSRSLTSTSASTYPPKNFVKVSCFSTSRAQPVVLLCIKTQSLQCTTKAHKKGAAAARLKRARQRKPFFAANSNMTITEYMEEEEESPPPLLESEMNSRPRRIALFIEPSPFSYVSGYKNRFQNFIKYLRELGDEVMVVTTHEGVPQEFYGAKLIGSRSFPCPWYKKVPLSLALSPRIISEVARFKPDIIHASSPGVMVFGALAIAKLLCVPIVMSYHTHVPVYIPRYTFSWLVKPMWLIIKFLHRAADLTLVPSAAIGKDLEAAQVTAANRIRLWTKGVDSESFHPRYHSDEMRLKLSGGEPQKPLIIHVGRLGYEKSLDFLERIMDKLPEARIAFIGDGPYREELENMFRGKPAVFMGMLHGEELSQAYASGDVFIMPSESETLGLVVLEAMSSGLPVVAARAGGIPDIIPEDQQGKIGYLFNPGDVDDCLSKLKPLLHDLELRETIGNAARLEMEKFDWRAATRKIRNEQYNAAIWFWRKKRAQLLRPFQWLFKRIFQAPEVDYR